MTINYMPLVHQARRTIRNRQECNPFATDTVIDDLLGELEIAYAATQHEHVARALKVETDNLRDLINA